MLFSGAVLFSIQLFHEKVKNVTENFRGSFLPFYGSSPSTQLCSPESDTFAPKRVAGRKVPVPASSPSVSPVRPAPLLAEVQKGITVTPVKSWLSTKLHRMRGASPHQMG